MLVKEEIKAVQNTAWHGEKDWSKSDGDNGMMAFEWSGSLPRNDKLPCKRSGESVGEESKWI